MMNLEPRNFRDLDDQEILQVLTWRNHPLVRQFMNSDVLISEKDHLTFVEHLKKQPNKDDYWKVNDIGVIYLNKIDQEHQTAHLGIYVNFENTANGKGVQLMSILLNTAFCQMGLKTIFLEVFENNTAAIKLYARFGFKPLKSFIEDAGIIIRNKRIFPMRLTVDEFDELSST